MTVKIISIDNLKINKICGFFKRNPEFVFLTARVLRPSFERRRNQRCLSGDLVRIGQEFNSFGRSTRSMAHFEMFGCIDRRSSCTFAPSWTGEQQIPERAIRQDDIGYFGNLINALPERARLKAKRRDCACN
jgi:hypothetical protein